jgi:hypothetical protein
VQQTRDGVPVSEAWSCGVTKRIQPGSRLFLLKQGTSPKGIMASGHSTSGVYEDEHWDRRMADAGRTARYIGAEWEIILEPASEPLLPVVAFQTSDLPAVHWNTQSSGISVPGPVADRMEALWFRHVEGLRGGALAGPGEHDLVEETEFPEGRVLYRMHRFRERNSRLTERAKAAALRRDGRLACQVCGFDFYATYGDVGNQFIECHHTIPVSELTAGMKTKLADIALVCPNCHRMLHRHRPWLSLAELRDAIGTRLMPESQ